MEESVILQKRIKCDSCDHMNYVIIKREMIGDRYYADCEFECVGCHKEIKVNLSLLARSAFAELDTAVKETKSDIESMSKELCPKGLNFGHFFFLIKDMKKSEIEKEFSGIVSDDLKKVKDNILASKIDAFKQILTCNKCEYSLLCFLFGSMEA